jgi:hypothetical protein
MYYDTNCHIKLKAAAAVIALCRCHQPGVVGIAGPADDGEVPRGIDHFDGQNMTLPLQPVGLYQLAPELTKEEKRLINV